MLGFALWFRSFVFKWIKVFRGNISKSTVSKIYACICMNGEDDIDPYIVARLIPFRDITGKTSVAYGAGADPEWTEGNVISLKVPEVTGVDTALSHIHLECWDRDKFTWDDYLGGTNIDMLRADGTPVSFGKGKQDYQLVSNGVITGELTVEIRMIWHGEKEAEVPSNTSTPSRVQRFGSFRQVSGSSIFPSLGSNGRLDQEAPVQKNLRQPREDDNPFEVPSLPWYAEESTPVPLAGRTNEAFAGSEIEITVHRGCNIVPKNYAEGDVGDAVGIPVRFASFLLLGYFAIGILHYMLIEGWSFDVSMYFIIVTLTTIGYGDYVPSTEESKLFTGFYAQIGVLAIGAAMVIIFTSIFEHQQKMLIKVMAPSKSPQDLHNEQLREQFIISSRIVCLFLGYIGVIMIGTLFYHHYEGLSMVDSFYMMNITLSSVGYGDSSPSTWQGRVFFICTVPPGYVAGVQLVTNVLNIVINKRKERILAEMLGLKKNLRATEITSWDDDGDSKVNELEFTVGMLKKMGKVSQSDIDKIKQCFKEVDSDNSGDLHLGEITGVYQKERDKRKSAVIKKDGKNKSVVCTSMPDIPHMQSASDTSASGKVFTLRDRDSLDGK